MKRILITGANSHIGTSFENYVKLWSEAYQVDIENLTEFIRLIIENNESGVFWPQNAEYYNTSLLVKNIAAAHGKKIKLIGGLRRLIMLVGHIVSKINKAFANLVYDAAINEYKQGYYVVALRSL